MLGFHPLSQEPISALEDAAPVVVESTAARGVFRTRGFSLAYTVRRVFHTANDDSAPVVVTEVNVSDVIARRWKPFGARNVQLLFHGAQDDNAPVVVIDNNPHDAIRGRYKVTLPNRGMLFHAAQDTSFFVEANPHDSIVNRFTAFTTRRTVFHDAQDFSAPIVVIDTNPSDGRHPIYMAFKLPLGRLLLYRMGTAQDIDAPPPPAGGGGHKVPDLRRKGLTWVRYRR